MVNNTITLNFEIEKGELIDPYYFSARIKLASESKNLLREKLGSTVQLDNLDDYFNLNPENFYIYYNNYGGNYGRNELYIRDNNGRFLASNLPLNHYGFSMELSSNDVSSADYGFYPLYAIYNPNHYNKAQEKRFDDHGKLLPTVSDILDELLSNKNNLATQDVLQNVFSQLQKEAAEEADRLAREREEERQREEELNKKNEELKELIEKDEIKVFKVIKGHDIGDGRSAAVLQFYEKEGGEITLDSSKYCIVEYKHHSKDEGDEYLSCPDNDMLVGYEDLFFVLNQSSYSDFESGFYSANSTDPHNYAKYSKDRYLSSDQLSEELSSELEKDSHQVEVMLNDQPVSGKRGKRSLREDEEKQEEITVTGTMMKDNKEEDYLQHPLKIKVGEAIEAEKYKVELQVAYDDIRNFYNTILGKYQTSKEYNHEQVSVLCNGVIIPIHGHYDEPFTLPEAHVTNGHLFIKNQDFGILNDFNEMFYKSDDLI